MASERFTVRLDDEAAAWVEQMQEEHDRSRAWVIREAVDLARGEPSAFGGAEGTGAHRGGPHRDGAESTTDLRDRVDALEQRLDALEAGGDTPTDSEGAHSGAEPIEAREDSHPSPTVSNGRGSAPDPTDDVRERLREELPGSGDRLDARVDAIVAMRDELRERGEAERGDLLDAVDVEATGYADANSLWKNTVAGRDTLRALDGVKRPPTGRSEWRWSGST
jgi:hypothetical protein